MNIVPPDQGAFDPGRRHRYDLALKLTDDDQLVELAARRPVFDHIAAPVNRRQPGAGDYEFHDRTRPPERLRIWSNF